MSEEIIIHPIAHIESDFATKFGVPRQAGIVEELESLVVFEPKYRNPDAFRGLEDFSHIWLIWQFSETVRKDWSPTVRPPRLGGNERKGVFATRSPFRPNSLALSCVRLLEIVEDSERGICLRIGGADMMNGTPVLDVKPYIPYADSKLEASGGFAPNAGDPLKVHFAEGTLNRVPTEKQKALCGVLANDPRPRYQEDPDRIYGMEFAGMEVKFRVLGDEVLVECVQ